MRHYLTKTNNIISDIPCLLRSYASIFFVPNARIGALFLLATFWYPNSGIAGLLSAIVGTFTARFFQFSNISGGLYAYNSLLVGLALGSSFELSFYLLGLILLTSVLTVFMTVTVADALWRFERLPALSLPFVIVAITITFASQGFYELEHYNPHLFAQDLYIPNFIKQFFTALGATFFTPHPLAGMLIFIGILFASPYLGFLAISGYTVGYLLYQALSGAADSPANYSNAFNFILTTMALGGIFMVPSLSSFVVALLGAALATLTTMAAQSFMNVYGLPVMAIPFLLTTLIILSALAKRMGSVPPYLLLHNPDLPEKSKERSRLLEVRGGQINSIPVYAPFQGKWTVYQGFNGQYTHKEPWQHALDFIITVDKKSHHGEGLLLTDYYCYGAPVLSPVYGTVARCINDQPDNKVGEVDVKNNWGNLVLIRLYDGNYLLLCHLQEYSIQVFEGQTVTPNMLLAYCGNSGRSPQPHLHLHIQKTALLGSPTIPFHLTQVLTQGETQESTFRLYSRPLQGEFVSPLVTDSGLKQALHLPVGKQLLYRFKRNNEEWETRILNVTVDPTGRFCLESNLGAKTCFIEDQQMLSFYERNHVEDDFLDMFVLALSVTPFGEESLKWRDRPSKTFLSHSLVSSAQRLHWFWIHSKDLTSDYYRTWDDDQSVWQQRAKHTLGNGKQVSITTNVLIKPNIACTKLSLNDKNNKWLAELHTFGINDDVGIKGLAI